MSRLRFSLTASRPCVRLKSLGTNFCSRIATMSDAPALVAKLWNYCNVLRDDGLSYQDYIEQLTYLLFLKMADELARPPFNRPPLVPADLDWQSLLDRDGDELEVHYRHILTELGRRPGTLGVIFRKAHNFIARNYPLDPDQKRHLRFGAFRGWEIVDNAARLCQMNLLLHGIGAPEAESPVTVADALQSHPGKHFEMVLTNPPFGKKSAITVVGPGGEVEREDLTYVRDDFWATTSNKQLNFLQHVKTLLSINGRAAIVVPDNVLFEGGAGETVRRKLLHECDVHTLLRLPTGIFYAGGVKANVLFFDRKPASEAPWTKKLWIYDFRTNQHFTLKERPLRYEDLFDFIRAYNPANHYTREESERFRAFTYEDLVARDKASLDIFWLRDESLEDSANLPPPEVIAAEIVEDLEAALSEFAQVAQRLAGAKVPDGDN